MIRSHLSYLFLVVSLSCLFLNRCASPRGLSGGPADSIPPTLLSSDPTMGQLNVDQSRLSLLFDETIDAQQIKNKLILTPNIESDYKFVARKETLVLTFEDPFPDSTTISLNFADAVTDVTEKNPAENLRLVFSTGDFLDSMFVTGSLINHMTQQPVANALVGLYANTDTLNTSRDRPLYFSKTDDEGLFTIQNIMVDSYRMLAFIDENNNLLFEADTEGHGFLPGPLALDTPVNKIVLPIVKQNASPLTFISARALGQYYDLSYSKPLDSIHMIPSFSHRFDLENNQLRLYQPDTLNASDSTQTIFTVFDSLGNTSIDTLFVKFSSSTRRPLTFKETYTASSDLIDTASIQVSFNKPITSFVLDSVSIQLDSLASFEPDTLISRWNTSNTTLSIQIPIDTSFFLNYQRDTLASDTTLRRPINYKVQISIPENSFISVENDSSGARNLPFEFVRTTQRGKLFLNTTNTDTTNLPIRVQIMTKTYETVIDVPFKDQLRFNTLMPGEFGVRYLYDNNGRSGWDQGNYQKDISPDKIYVYDKFSTLRANWEVTLDILLPDVNSSE